MAADARNAAIEPSPEAMRVRTALVPFVHAAVPWWWFACEAWGRGDRIGDVLYVPMVVTMSAALLAAGAMHAVSLRRCPEQLALLASLLFALASPFVAAALAGVAFAPLAWVSGDSGLVFVGTAVMFPATFFAHAPVRFVGTMFAVGWLAWLLVRPALRVEWRRALAGAGR